MEYKRFENESDDALIFRICKERSLRGLTWQQVADILNPLLGTDYGESTFRKKFASFTQMFEANRELFTNNEAELERLREEERRLEIEKIKFRDERNAWSRQNRVQARVEAKLDNVEDALTDFGRIYFPEPIQRAATGSGKAMLVMLNDLHIGASYDNYWGKYNVDVARDRLGQLLAEIKKIAKRHEVDEIFVSLGGDQISGNIHHSIQVTNRENVIEQVKRASELIASFCYELTQLVPMVTMVSVDGNHSRLTKKEDAIHAERLDSLIAWCVKVTLNHIKNFKYLEEANIDSGIALFPIRDKWYVSVHGDYDSFSRGGVQNLITMIKAIPYAVLFGHKHTCAIDDVNDIKIVQGGSLAGAGDQFTVEKRIRGGASQMVCICGDDGIEAYYPVELK